MTVCQPDILIMQDSWFSPPEETYTTLGSLILVTQAPKLSTKNTIRCCFSISVPCADLHLQTVNTLSKSKNKFVHSGSLITNKKMR